MGLGTRAQFVRQALGQTLDSRLGCVVRGIATVRSLASTQMADANRNTHGGFVMPCFDPVLMMTDWFS